MSEVPTGARIEVRIVSVSGVSPQQQFCVDTRIVKRSSIDEREVLIDDETQSACVTSPYRVLLAGGEQPSKPSNPMVFRCPRGLPLVDKNAPLDERSTTDYYYYLELTLMQVIKEPKALPSRRAPPANGSATNPQQWATMGTVNVFLNSMEAETLHRERLHVFPASLAGGVGEETATVWTIEADIRLFQCGVLQKLEPPRSLEKTIHDLVGAEISDVFTPDFVRITAECILRVLAARSPSLAPDTMMISSDPSSESFRAHTARQSALQMAKATCRPTTASRSGATRLDKVIEAARCPVRFVECVGVALSFDDLLAFIAEMHLHTGTKILPDAQLREDMQLTLTAFAKQQRAERALVEKIRSGADATLHRSAIMTTSHDDATLHEMDESAQNDNDDEDDDEFALLTVQEALREQRDAEDEALLIEMAPKNSLMELLTSWERVVGRSRARRTMQHYRTQMRMGLDGAQSVSSSALDPDNLRHRYSTLAPHYVAALDRRASARADALTRIANLREQASITLLLSVNETMRLLCNLSKGPLLVRTLSQHRWTLAEAPPVVPIYQGPGARWACPLLAVADDAVGDLVKTRRAKQMTLPPPPPDDEAMTSGPVVSPCLPAPRSFPGYRRANGQVITLTLRPIIGLDVPPSLRLWQPPALIDYNAVVAKETRRKARMLRGLAKEHPGTSMSDIESMLRPVDYELTPEELEHITTRTKEASRDVLTGVVLSRLRLIHCTVKRCFVVECVIVGGRVEDSWVEGCQVESDAQLVDLKKLRSSHVSGNSSVVRSLPVNCVMLDATVVDCAEEGTRTTLRSGLQRAVTLCTLARCTLTKCALVQCKVHESHGEECRDEGYNLFRSCTGIDLQL